MYVISEILVTPILLQMGSMKNKVSAADFALLEMLPSFVLCFFILRSRNDDGRDDLNIMEIHDRFLSISLKGLTII